MEMQADAKTEDPNVVVNGALKRDENAPQTTPVTIAEAKTAESKNPSARIVRGGKKTKADNSDAQTNAKQGSSWFPYFFPRSCPAILTRSPITFQTSKRRSRQIRMLRKSPSPRKGPARCGQRKTRAHFSKRSTSLGRTLTLCRVTSCSRERKRVSRRTRSRIRNRYGIFTTGLG